MRVIRFHGFPHSDTYTSHAVNAWKADTTEHVDDVEADRLLATFGEAFSDETPAPKKPVKAGK